MALPCHNHRWRNVTENGRLHYEMGKNHKDLATTERYMGSFDTSKTDNTLRSLFTKKKVSNDGMTVEERQQQAIELLKGLSPEQIMPVISAINK